MATKRERPPNFFDEEDEDLDYLIEASIDNENNKENNLVGLDDYLSQKPTDPKPSKK
jgi:hypothetical protein